MFTGIYLCIVMGYCTLTGKPKVPCEKNPFFYCVPKPELPDEPPLT